MEVIHTPSPRASSEVHTPPAPVHGYEDAWNPYSPRKSARLSQRANNRTPSPNRFSSRKQPDHRPSLGSPKPSKHHHLTSNMATPAISPQKKRTPATASSRRVSGTLRVEDAFGLEPPRGRPGVSTNGGMLITPAKTPQKPPTEQNKAKINSIARNLFHNDSEVMPTPKKTRAQKFAFDSFSADDEVDEPIQIYTDSRERIPEIDRSSDNPFYVGQNAQTSQPTLRRSKRQTVTIPGEGKVLVEEAVGRTDGIVTTFRGKVTFRKYADNTETSTNDRELLDGADGGLESAVESRVTRSTVKPRLLFPVKKQEEPKVVDEDEEAVTDIEDHVLASLEEEEKEPSTPMDLASEKDLATPEAPRFAPASPPTTARTTRFGSKKAGDATPVKPGPRGKRSPFDGWRRTKGGVESKGHKRAGDDALPASPVKRTRI